MSSCIERRERASGPKNGYGTKTQEKEAAEAVTILRGMRGKKWKVRREDNFR